MLRPVARVPSWTGLEAGFNLQIALALWLCDVNVTPAHLTKAGVRAVHPNEHVQNWLWRFLYPRRDKARLLKAAKAVAAQSSEQKQILRDWINVIRDVAAQFGAQPAAWLAPPTNLPRWEDFKELMQGFYEKLGSGLPFDAAGNPVDSNGVTYTQFVNEFKQAHGDRVCVLCDGPFSGPQVDHWIGKADFPLLAIAPHNLLPICCDCNEPPAKGTKPTYTLGIAEAFKEWFHPYHCPGYGRVSMVYEITKFAVSACALAPADATRVQHLDSLLNLSSRWTGTFKAEHRNRQKALRQLIDKGYLAATKDDIREKLTEWKVSLADDQEHFHVSNLMLDHALDPDSLNGWVKELTAGDALEN